jgi:hypothetical protein
MISIDDTNEAAISTHYNISFIKRYLHSYTSIQNKTLLSEHDNANIIYNYCDTGWHETSDACYLYIVNDRNTTVSVTSAEDECSAINAHLISVNTNNERSSIAQHLQQYVRVCIYIQTQYLNYSQTSSHG